MRVNVLKAGTYFNLLEWKDKSGSIYGLCEGMQTLDVFEDQEQALLAFEQAEAKVNRTVTCITSAYVGNRS